MSIRTDKRCIEATEVPGADARLDELAKELLTAELAVARHLAVIDSAGHYGFSGCVTIGEYGSRFGIEATRARDLARLGTAIQKEASLEPALACGETTMERALVIAKPLARGKPADLEIEWVKAARHETPWHLRRLVRKQDEVVAQETPDIEHVSIYAHTNVRDDLERARVLSSRRAGKILTPGQTLARVVDFYLDANDPLRKKPRARRQADTRLGARTRTISAEVRRAVLERAQGTCEVPGCTHSVFLEFAHIHPFAKGAANEVEDLRAICTRHHVLYDARILKWDGKKFVRPKLKSRDAGDDRGSLGGRAGTALIGEGALTDALPLFTGPPPSRWNRTTPPRRSVPRPSPGVDHHRGCPGSHRAD